MTNSALTISRVAGLVGVGVETIRYYQRIGLIAEPPKPASGYRRYPQATVTRLIFIQRAKQLGFSLTEIAELLALDETACSQTQQLAERKLELIQSKIAALQSMAEVLDGLVHSCKTNTERCACPIIRSLSES